MPMEIECASHRQTQHATTAQGLVLKACLVWACMQPCGMHATCGGSGGCERHIVLHENNPPCKNAVIHVVFDGQYIPSATHLSEQYVPSAMATHSSSMLMLL